MKFALEVSLHNEAMTSLDDVVGALQRAAIVARELDGADHLSMGDNGRVRDDNGNVVGLWAVRR